MSDSKATNKELEHLHSLIATQLAEAVVEKEVILDKNGEVVGKRFNIAAISAARQFLKDNNITGVRKEGNALDALAEAAKNLPYGEDEHGGINPHFTH